MPASKKAQASLDSFFRPAQPASKPVLTSSQPAPRADFTAQPNMAHVASIPSTQLIESRAGDSEAAQPTSSSELPGHTGCLSPHPSNDPFRAAPSTPEPSVPSNALTGRVVRSSDDEDEDSDSDSSLEDLTTLLQSHRSDNRPHQNRNTNVFTPSTPNMSRFKRTVNFHTSPLAVLPKYKFDLKSLASQAETDIATEASSKRVKAMLAAQEHNKELAVLTHGEDSEGRNFKHNDLLESVVADREEGNMHKVTRALMRTEATLPEKRWYFFDIQTKPSKPDRLPFPTKSVPERWKNDLADPQLRSQTFISGFAEDMVSFGNMLPDEIFLWMLDEICIESSEPLRNSYCGVLKESSEQVRRLIVPNIIQKMFRALGGSSTTVTVTQKIKPVHALSEPYPKRDWAKLRSVIKFLGQIGDLLQARTHVICILLRMCVDRVIFENVDLLDLVQETVNRLCRYIPDDSWETCCQEICTPMFNSVEQPTLRLQIAECIPSTSPRTHDLRRRLATSFYFNDLSYSLKHSHLTMDLHKFLNRVEDSEFNCNPQTDYRELAALMLLLDIAVDDGRPADLDLTNQQTGKRYDDDIEAFAATIKDVMRSIGNPGAAFISRIEAKEVLELVSQRISDTLRSKPKPKQTVFDGLREKAEEDLDSERSGMASFLSKTKTRANGGDDQALN